MMQHTKNNTLKHYALSRVLDTVVAGPDYSTIENHIR